MKLLLPSLILASLLVLVPMNAEAKTFENKDFTFEYPNGCNLEKKDNRYSTAKASLECKGDAGFQFETSEDDLTFLQTDDEMVDHLKSVFEFNYDNTDIAESGTDKYIINNRTAPYIIGTYDQEFEGLFGLGKTKPYVLMTVLVKISDDHQVLVQYRNSEDQFDKFLPQAEKIFQSVEGLGNGTPVTETLNDTDTNTNTNTETYNSDEFPQTGKYCNNVKTQLGKELCDKLLS